MQSLNGYIMSGNITVGTVRDGVITEFDERLLPLYLKRTRNAESWLASRAIDSKRVNSRLLKKALRLTGASDSQSSLFVNGATVTDRYWFKWENSDETYEDIRFKENPFDMLALCGDPNSFSKKPSKTPELTNIGSFEKCWRLADGKWWLYKNGNENELFSELFVSTLAKALGLNSAHYELDGNYIRSLDFTDGASVNFEPISGIMGENDDYADCFSELCKISKSVAEQYLTLIWLDTVCFNMDRHTENFGILRDINTGEVISLAPNFDNNIALISRGYPKDITRKTDGLIRFFREFIESTPEAKQMYKEMHLPNITPEAVKSVLAKIPVKVDGDYILNFILNGQAEVSLILTP